jgi:hypothetical protein
LAKNSSDEKSQKDRDYAPSQPPQPKSLRAFQLNGWLTHGKGGSPEMLVSPFVVLPTPFYSGGSRRATVFLSGIGPWLLSCEIATRFGFLTKQEG